MGLSCEFVLKWHLPIRMSREVERTRVRAMEDLKCKEKNIDQVDSTLAFKLYIHKSVFEQVQYSDHHTYIPIQDNMACRLLVFW